MTPTVYPRVGLRSIRTVVPEWVEIFIDRQSLKGLPLGVIEASKRRRIAFAQLGSAWGGYLGVLGDKLSEEVHRPEKDFITVIADGCFSLWTVYVVRSPTSCFTVLRVCAGY